MSLLRVFSPRPLLSLSISLVYFATRHFFLTHMYITAKLQKRTDDDDDSENISVSSDEMIIVFNSGKRETLSLSLSKSDDGIISSERICEYREYRVTIYRIPRAAIAFIINV